MPYNILPAPSQQFDGDYVLYQIELPDDDEYRALLVGALSFSADAESYQRRRQLPIDAFNAVEVAAYSIQTLRPVVVDPIGVVKVAGFRNDADAPENWLRLNGQTVPEADYPDLYDSTKFVTRAGSNLVLADFRLQHLRGSSGDFGVGEQIGQDSFTLSIDNLPPHKHLVTDFGATIVTLGTGAPVTVTSAGAFPVNTTFTGGGRSVNHQPRAIGVDFWLVARLS